jgi:GxxExxY protein
MPKTFDANPDAERIATQVVDSAIEMHRHPGPGLAEAPYEDALCIELGLRNVPFARQPPVSLEYKGIPIGQGRVDLLVGSLVVVELKAVEALLPVHHAQVLAHLKMTGLELGLLLYFNKPLMKDGVRRIIHQEAAFASSRLRVEKSEHRHGK